MISQESLKGNWNQIVGAVRHEFGQITGDDLSRVRGSVEELMGMIQEKTGRSREQIEAFLGDCCRSGERAWERASESASQVAGAANEALHDGYQRARQSAQQGYDQTVRTVSQRPLESLAVAVGVGLLAGLVVGLSMAGRRR